MTKLATYQSITYFSALVWLIMGLVFKILSVVPRHENIVGRILGEDYAFWLTKFIGVGEIFIALWILSGIKKRWVVLLQISLVATMNVLEFFNANDLLLWGKTNAIFAFLFIALLFYNEFILRPKIEQN